MALPTLVQYRNPLQGEGFAQVYHFITQDVKLSDGAFRTYVLLLKYAQQKVKLWTGVARMACDRGVNVATISRHLAELERRGLIARQRRMGRSSITYIEDVVKVYPHVAARQSAP